MARDGGLTAHGIVMTRKAFFAGQPGLTLVDTEQGFYEPPDALVEWMGLNKAFFLEGTDRRLVPRGVAFAGPPGVGKTAGAKWAAEYLGVPLYRMDLGGAKNKWQGMSESNNLANLQRLDREEPCCVLFDEVEKVFGGDHNDNTTATMLAQLLWWLAEHRSRVLTIMTTNNLGALPKELYREGRINTVIYFNGLENGAAGDFAKAILNTFTGSYKPGLNSPLKDIVKAAMEKPLMGCNPPMVSHARVTEVTYDWIKRHQA
jgi:SpoVK/Ycf46/Vps4 family AAA+-type ATPase